MSEKLQPVAAGAPEWKRRAGVSFENFSWICPPEGERGQIVLAMTAAFTNKCPTERKREQQYSGNIEHSTFNDEHSMFSTRESFGR
jgi:hypothetical protein